jgi:hypothetical protein
VSRVFVRQGLTLEQPCYRKFDMTNTTKSTTAAYELTPGQNRFLGEVLCSGHGMPAHEFRNGVMRVGVHVDDMSILLIANSVRDALTTVLGENLTKQVSFWHSETVGQVHWLTYPLVRKPGQA